MQKVHFIQQEARRQGKRVYRVDIDFKNAFNAMSQATRRNVVYWNPSGRSSMISCAIAGDEDV